jgi:hypothetical protein
MAAAASRYLPAALAQVALAAATDPASCDRHGWSSCYKVGYDDGLGRSGPCPSGHSAAFCAGWNEATHSNNN